MAAPGRSFARLLIDAQGSLRALTEGRPRRTTSAWLQYAQSSPSEASSHFAGTGARRRRPFTDSKVSHPACSSDATPPCQPGTVVQTVQNVPSESRNSRRGMRAAAARLAPAVPACDANHAVADTLSRSTRDTQRQRGAQQTAHYADGDVGRRQGPSPTEDQRNRVVAEG